MLTFAGKYLFGESPTNSELPFAVHAILKTRGPDDSRTLVLGPVRMTCCSFHTTSESQKEPQPFISVGQVALMWDGRLDNREELAGLLSPLSSMSGDAEYVSTSYENWGEDFAKHIQGDYALCLWDPRNNKIIMARDPFASRPLYYGTRNDCLFWASDIGALVNLLGTDYVHIDDCYAASFLTSTEDLDRTPYREIKSVPPGHLVIFSGPASKTVRFWSLDPTREIRYSSDAEYEDHFWALFRDSVRRRLRVNGTVAAELSGGLDSSSIVCMADDILRNGDCVATGVETISHVYDQSLSSDECKFISVVEEQRGKTGHYIKESEYPVFEPVSPELDIYLPSGSYCFTETVRGMNEVMKGIGARVLLSGMGGDHVFMNETFFLPILGDLIFAGRVNDFLHYLREWGKAARTSYTKLLWRGVAWPSLPSAVRRRLTLSELTLPDWMDRKFAKQWDCRGRLIARPGVRLLRRPSAERLYTLIQDAVSLASPSHYRNLCCVESSRPFLDQQLVEFLLAIPMEQQVGPGQPRFLHRRAMRRLLPKKIVERRGKRGPDEAVYRGMVRNRSWLTSLAQNSRLARRGYVEPAAFIRATHLACHGADAQIQPLIRALSLEMWLRSHERWSSRGGQAGDPFVSPYLQIGGILAERRLIP
jgi:asparagine synthase (glutamine-hydrolysing)